MKFVKVIKEKVTVLCHTHNISLEKPIDSRRYAKLTKFQFSRYNGLFNQLRTNIPTNKQTNNNCGFNI